MKRLQLTFDLLLEARADDEPDHNGSQERAAN